MPLLNEKQKLNLKIYIRLLLYVKDKYEKLQNSSKISSSLIEYLKKQIRENKKYNDELRYNQKDALDDTFTTLFIEKGKNITQGKNIAHILSSTSKPDSHEDTKTRMSKVVEKLLTSIKTMGDKEKGSYLDSELGIINKEDLKTLDEVLVERRAYFYDDYSKNQRNKDKKQILDTIDDIHILVKIKMPKSEGEKGEKGEEEY
jgi:hypothetical protein